MGKRVLFRKPDLRRNHHRKGGGGPSPRGCFVLFVVGAVGYVALLFAGCVARSCLPRPEAAPEAVPSSAAPRPIPLQKAKPATRPTATPWSSTLKPAAPSPPDTSGLIRETPF